MDGAGDEDRDENLARETNICLGGKSCLSSLSYGADLGLADDSALIRFAKPVCAAAASSISSCSDTASPSAIAC